MSMQYLYLAVDFVHQQPARGCYCNSNVFSFPILLLFSVLTVMFDPTVVSIFKVPLLFM